MKSRQSSSEVDEVETLGTRGGRALCQTKYDKRAWIRGMYLFSESVKTLHPLAPAVAVALVLALGLYIISNGGIAPAQIKSSLN